MIFLLSYNLMDIKLVDVIDILLVAVLLYQFYNLIKGTGAINIFVGIIAFYIVWKLVKALHMEMLGEILGAFISVGFIALIVVFQPEIRKFLFLLGTPNFLSNKPKRFFFWKLRIINPNQLEVYHITHACSRMSSSNTGALIVLARKNDLRNIAATGEYLDAKISSQLLENIFFKNSPLHDGAVIIFENRIIAARCILPVTDRQDIPDGLGLRHRAAIGITEQSDAIAVIVSEQTGNVSLCVNGILRQNITDADLTEILEEDFGKRQ
ncbi:MAG: diadenylate cyclase CdaA [Bacteroidales bacterium]